MFVYLLMGAGVLWGSVAGFRLGEVETDESKSEIVPCQSESASNANRWDDLKKIKEDQDKRVYGELEKGIQFSWKHDVFLSSTPLTYVHVFACAFLEYPETLPPFLQKHPNSGGLFYVGWDPRSARVLTYSIKKDLRCEPDLLDSELRQQSYICKTVTMDSGASPLLYEYILLTQMQHDEPLMLGMAMMNPLPIQKMINSRV